MLRTNLFRYLTLVVLITAGSEAANAQQHGNWQMPGMHIPRSQYQAPIVDYYGGQKPKLWDSEQPIERFVGELTKRSWMRFQYLHWDFDGLGDQVIGAPVANYDPNDVLRPLSLFDFQNNGTAAGINVFASTRGLEANDASGVRGTWGVDLNGVDFELEFFGTQNADSSYSITGISGSRTGTLDPITNITDFSLGEPARPNIAIPLLADGAVTDVTGNPLSGSQGASLNALIFDDSFSAELTSQMWGGEAILLSEPYIPDAGFSWQWLGGFRYLNYDEQFDFRGTFNGTTNAMAVTDVRSNTVNNMYGPEAGFRTSINNRFFTFSASPRVAMALNDYTARTNVVQLRSNPTPTGGSEQEVDFTPIVQVSLTGEIHVNDHFSIFGGYDFMWIHRVARPFDNLVYDRVANANPDIRQVVDAKSLAVEGLTFGCMFRY